VLYFYLNVKTSQQHLGSKGEKLALAHLRKNGYLILHCNYRIGRAEVDIIAEKQDCTVFIEVKTRSSIEFGYPETFVSKKQERTLIAAAEIYLAKNKEVKPIRYDIIAIIITREATTITHFEDAFWPMA
jgi:putative endonuclease